MVVKKKPLATEIIEKVEAKEEVIETEEVVVAENVKIEEAETPKIPCFRKICEGHLILEKDLPNKTVYFCPTCTGRKTVVKEEYYGR